MALPVWPLRFAAAASTTAIRRWSWATSTALTSPCTPTWLASSWCATAGSARFPARPCPIVCTPCAAARREAGMTCRPAFHPSTTKHPSSDTSTPMRCPGAGTALTRAHFGWPTFATAWDTTTSSPISARPGTLGERSWISPSTQRLRAFSKTPLAEPCRPSRGSTRRSRTSTLRRTRRLLRSRPATQGRGRRPRDVRPVRRAGTGDHRLTVGGTSLCVTHTVRSHLNHQNDSVALLSRGRRHAAESTTGARSAQHWPPPTPGHARGPCQPSRATSVSHDATHCPSARRPDPTRNSTGSNTPRNRRSRERSTGRGHPPAHRPPEADARGDPGAHQTGTSGGRPLGHTATAGQAGEIYAARFARLRRYMAASAARMRSSDDVPSWG
jgi:hypothetical protein